MQTRPKDCRHFFEKTPAQKCRHGNQIQIRFTFVCCVRSDFFARVQFFSLFHFFSSFVFCFSLFVVRFLVFAFFGPHWPETGPPEAQNSTLYPKPRSPGRGRNLAKTANNLKSRLLVSAVSAVGTDKHHHPGEEK